MQNNIFQADLSQLAASKLLQFYRVNISCPSVFISPSLPKKECSCENADIVDLGLEPAYSEDKLSEVKKIVMEKKWFIFCHKFEFGLV